MSDFESVDRSADPARLLAHLDAAAAGLVAMKQYVTAAARRAVGTGLVVDIGCGAGHDLDLLTAAGLDSIGIDASEVMLREAQRRSAEPPRLAQADAADLPIATASVDGCRIERVLIHVISPHRVLAEVARVVRPGGFLAAFEPDWSTFRFGPDDDDGRAAAGTAGGVRHRDIGRHLVRLVDGAGFRVLDVVTERSTAHRTSDLPVRMERLVDRAVRAELPTQERAAAWIDRMTAAEESGRFSAKWSKVLVVAERR